LLGLAGGLAVAAVKTYAAFHVWALPSMFELVNAFALLVALIALVVSRTRYVAGYALVIGAAMMSVPVTIWLADTRIDDAMAYCASPDGDPPALLQPGYSVRYEPHVGSNSCSFPDPFPGRTLWEGERRRDGTWTFEHLMD
jgi:hypothetical protein